MAIRDLEVAVTLGEATMGRLEERLELTGRVAAQVEGLVRMFATFRCGTSALALAMLALVTSTHVLLAEVEASELANATDLL